MKIFQGTHPSPSEQNIKATKKIIELVKSLDKNDLLITFICGGGSALACSSEKELRNSILATKELTKTGANITELNTVRKHLSEFKGGGLAKMAYPATVVSLIISDVCGNELSSVASGPTVFDKTTKKDAENILKKYFPHKSVFLSALVRDLRETPKDDKYFKAVKNILFVCNQDAVMAMVKKAEKLGFSVKIHSLALEGEAKNIFSSMIEKIKPREAIIAAGETTVTMNSELGIKSYKKGGRNQEAVLGAINNKQSAINNNLAIISFASDAHDNTEAAGAIGDYSTIKKAKKLKLNMEEFLKNYNSFNFFKKTGDLIYAKQKYFNVADLMVVLRK